MVYFRDKKESDPKDVMIKSITVIILMIMMMMIISVPDI